MSQNISLKEKQKKKLPSIGLTKKKKSFHFTSRLNYRPNMSIDFAHLENSLARNRCCFHVAFALKQQKAATNCDCCQAMILFSAQFINKCCHLISFLLY